MFPAIFLSIRNKDVRVSQCWNSHGWRWRFICRGYVASASSGSRRQLGLLKDRLLHFNPSTRFDSLKWRWTSHQKFTVNSLYKFITYAGQSDPTYQHLWKLKIPAKIKIFVRLLLGKRLLMTDKLIKWRTQVEPCCVFCALSLESCDYLFCNCIFVRFILLRLAEIPNNDSGEDVQDL